MVYTNTITSVDLGHMVQTLAIVRTEPDDDDLAALELIKSSVRGGWADRSYNQALQIKTRVLGSGHREIGALLNNIASLESDQGRLNEARAHYAHAIAIFKQTLGQDHPNTRTCAANLSRLGQNSDAK